MEFHGSAVNTSLLVLVADAAEKEGYLPTKMSETLLSIRPTFPHRHSRPTSLVRVLSNDWPCELNINGNRKLYGIS